MMMLLVFMVIKNKEMVINTLLHHHLVQLTLPATFYKHFSWTVSTKIKLFKYSITRHPQPTRVPNRSYQTPLRNIKNTPSETLLKSNINPYNTIKLIRLTGWGCKRYRKIELPNILNNTLPNCNPFRRI